MKAWEGASAIDGGRVMLCLSSLKSRCTNRKLGDMVQAWILPVEEPPQTAVKTGLDASVCGDCPRRPSLRLAIAEAVERRRGEATCPGDCSRCLLCQPRGLTNVYQLEHGLIPRRCYVIPWHVPKHMFECYGAGEADIRGARRAVVDAQKPVRVSAWGDPTAIPLQVWKLIIPPALWGPGYTRRWRQHPEFRGLLMASVESVAEAEEAQDLGWRTYRIAAEA